jgi:hypothetical protein
VEHWKNGRAGADRRKRVSSEKETRKNRALERWNVGKTKTYLSQRRRESQRKQSGRLIDYEIIL